jgi:kynurenine formamidase
MIGIADLPVLAASGATAVIDIPPDADGPPGRSPTITTGDIERWENAHGQLLGEVVLFRTGWDRHHQPGPAGSRYGCDVLITGNAPGWPAPTPDTVDLLRERGVTCIGTDGLWIGPAEGGAPTHLAGLPHGMVYVEALTNLDQPPVRGAWFLFLPIKLVGGTGGPGRAIAVRPPSTNQDSPARYSVSCSEGGLT